MLRQAAMISDAGSGCWWLPGRRTVDGGRLWGQRLSLLRVCSLCEMSSNLVKAFMESEIIQGSCLRMKKMIHSSVKSPTPSWRQAAGEEQPWAPVGDFRGDWPCWEDSAGGGCAHMRVDGLGLQETSPEVRTSVPLLCAGGVFSTRPHWGLHPSVVRLFYTASGRRACSQSGSWTPCVGLGQRPQRWPL